MSNIIPDDNSCQKFPTSALRGTENTTFINNSVLSQSKQKQCVHLSAGLSLLIGTLLLYFTFHAIEMVFVEKKCKYLD